MIVFSSPGCKGGLGLQVRGGSAERDLIQAGFQIERNGFADDGELLVVNGERGVGGKAGPSAEKGQNDDFDAHDESSWS
ncbi:MAG TPA: hypothetical protein VNH83_31945 [Bryobacteraceae bacterium]|nr:hypothetical protein [Bryobacteraceae bacterium]